ncbi:MAG TPA: hypothetical protein VJQ56_11355, partial [Blastocatellia bacterium]|nr:hypothetical protein [Blastocatellia bacterium]
SATNAYFMADTVDYIESVLTGSEFWEFGHLFWRPLGRVTFLLFEPVTSRMVGADPETNVLVIFMAYNWIAGLASVLLIYKLARLLSESRPAAILVTVAFSLSHGFLNFAQTGSSYIPGLASLLLGLFLLVKAAKSDPGNRWLAIGGGVALACAVCFWFLYIWAVPAALAAPLVLSGLDYDRRKLATRAALACAVAIGLSYSVVLIHLGIYTPTDLRAWVAASSHGITELRGVTRVAFGVPRSLVHMGDDATLFKRFLLNDSLNPVSALDLLRLSLWKLAFFYLFVAALVINLSRSTEGKRALALLGLAAAPLIGFAIFFDGASVERYLPLYPLLFLSLAVSLAAPRSLKSLKLTTVAFVIVMALTSVLAMSKPALASQEQAISSRIAGLAPLLRPASLLVTMTQQDELVNFQRAALFNPIILDLDLNVYTVIELGSKYETSWREMFAAKALDVWDRGGDVWVSKRLFTSRPRAEWAWVEAENARVSWTDVQSFFAGKETGQELGGADGFMLLLPTPINRQSLEAVKRPAVEEARAGR